MARSKKALGEDPLFNPYAVQAVNEPANAAEVTEEEVKRAEVAYKNLKKAYRKVQAKKNQQESEYTRMTFIVRRELLQGLRDYAKRKRITIKESLERALEEFLKIEE